MSENEQGQLRATQADSSKAYLFWGLAGMAIVYAAAGVFSILGSVVMAALPLNTPGFYDVIGRMQHVYQLRWGVSTAFFVLAASTIIIGYFYCKTTPATWKTQAARILAITQQPWIPLVFVVIAAIWLVQGFDPDGDVASFFAAGLGINVGDTAGRLEYQYMMGTMPSFAFMFFGVFSMLLLPFTFYTSTILLQDTGAVLNKRQRVKPMSFEQRARMYACKGLFLAGIIYMLVGIMFYAIGYVFSIGLDLTYPLLSMWNYNVYLNVYPWFPVGFGAFCMITAFLYYFKPTMPAFRIMAWVAVAVQCAIPLIGWFFAILLGRELWYSGQQQTEGPTAKRQMLLGLIIGAAVVIVTVAIVAIVSA